LTSQVQHGTKLQLAAIPDPRLAGWAIRSLPRHGRWPVAL